MATIIIYYLIDLTGSNAQKWIILSDYKVWIITFKPRLSPRIQG